MYSIVFTQRPDFTGTYMTIPFVNGVAIVSSLYLASRFKSKGLLVELIDDADNLPNEKKKSKKTKK